MKMATGTVKWFNATKGYGFIGPDGGGKDVFVHIADVQRAQLQTLAEGTRLEYEISEHRKGRNRGKQFASDLRVL
jgi:cold shock protein